MIPAVARTSVLLRTACALITIGGFVYISSIPDAILGWPLDPHLSYLSELSAKEFSQSWFFRFTDALSGVFLAMGALVFALRQSHVKCWSLLQWVICVSVLVMGVATVIDVTLTPLTCPVSLPECAERSVQGAVRLSGRLHSVSSGTAGTGLAVAGLGLALTAIGPWRIGVGASGFWQRRGPRLVMALLGVLVFLLLVMLAAADLGGIGVLGITQRIQVLFSGPMLALCSVPLASRSAPCRG